MCACVRACVCVCVCVCVIIGNVHDCYLNDLNKMLFFGLTFVIDPEFLLIIHHYDIPYIKDP